MMGWYTIIEPLPNRPTSWADLPHVGPYALLDDLLLEFAGIDNPTTQAEPEDRETGRVSGITGTTEVGYRWAEQVCRETSALPAGRRAALFGVDGVELIWLWADQKMGQAGHVGFTHRTLWVRFGDPQARGRFERVWAERFGGRPVFTEIEDPPE